MKGIGPQLPLFLNDTDGTYALIKQYKEEIKQNFKNLLLTSPGERMMNPDFGVGLRQFLFNPSIQVVPAVKTRIQKQTNKYLPFIQIKHKHNRCFRKKRRRYTNFVNRHTLWCSKFKFKH